jgi:hypothetical protein
MDNVIEVVALLRKHSELELQMLNGHSAAVAVAVATERALEATVHRLAAHPQALNAVLQTARAFWSASRFSISFPVASPPNPVRTCFTFRSISAGSPRSA